MDINENKYNSEDGMNYHLRSLHTDNGVTTKIVVAEARKKYPDCNVKCALEQYFNLMKEVWKRDTRNEKIDSVVMSKLAITALLLEPFYMINKQN